MLRKPLYLLPIVLLLASCQRELDWNDAPEIKATVEDDSETRTSISVNSSGAGTIYWNQSDQIDVFFGTKKATYISQNSSNATTATFKKSSGSVSASDVSSTNIWGLYPSNSSSTCNGSAITTTLPSTQYGVENTFDKDLFLAVAHSTTTNLQFYNVCGGIKFSLYRDDIASITFRGNNNENIAGTVSISFVSGVPKATITSGVKEITLTPKTGTKFVKDADYYITLLPGTLSNGFTMTFTTTNGTVGTLNYTDNSVTIRRSVFSRKGNVDAYAAFADGKQPNNVIYYTSTDGSIIVPNETDIYFGANIVSNEYVGGRGVITFDGDVTSIGYYSFCNCRKLTSISIPSSVTSIGSNPFSNCSGLVSIIVDSRNPSYDSRDNCNAIINTGTNALISGCMNTTIPNSVTSIGADAFWGCSGLNSITIPTSVTSIGSSAFDHCSGLSSIAIPSSVTSIGNNPFKGCSGLVSIVVDLGNLSYDSRNNCNAIINTNMNALISGCMNTTIPNSVTSIGDYAFLGCDGLTSITIPNSVTSIGTYAFLNCIGLTSITVEAMTHPSLGSNVFDATNDCPIYVPASSVDTYKSAWRAYASRIRAMGEFYDAVDLGLSVKWATCNVGADTPEEYGDYFAWGETESKSNYAWPTYKWCNGSYSTFTKYCNNSSYGYNGFTDNKTVLDLEDDAARANWGGSWRMPTDAEWTELRTQCVWTRTTLGGKNGYNVRGPNGNTIFLPAAGYRYGTSLSNAGFNGSYWSSSLSSGNPPYALSVHFNSSNVTRSSYYRYYGPSVRPVYGDFIGVSSVALNKSSLTFVVGDSETLIPTVMPDNATEKMVTWSSSNTSVATVSSEGTVTALSAGTATITAISSDGMKSATCTVTVTQSVTGLSISPDNPTIYTGEQVTLTATVTPSTASNPSVSWTSSDSSVAFVSSDGQVLGLKAGIAAITAQANDGSGVSATCTVTVKQHVTSVSMNAEAQIAWGGSMQLSATVLPADASDKSLTWSSSDESVASVSASGHVTGNLNGTATITATSVDGGYSASCVLTVTLPTTRSHLALVLSKNGDAASRYYLTSEQYSKANLSGYYKQGVCVFASSSYYIIANKDLYTSTSGSNANGAATMPNEELATWLISNMPSLNSALTSFGCTAMSTTGNYWTSKKRGDKYYYYFKYNGSLTFDSNASASCRARPVISF